MLRWLLVTKEKDYESENEFNWISSDKEEIKYFVDKNMSPGDKVLVYRSGQWTHLSHIFEVKECSNYSKGQYLVHLHAQKEIPNGIKISELKDQGIIKKNRKFPKRLYKIPLCSWSEIVGFTKDKYPDIFLSPTKAIFEGPDNRGYPKCLQKEFYKSIDKIRKLKETPNNEEATKYRMILPILKNMGFDIYDPKVFKPEFHISARFADFTLIDHQNNLLLIEAKQAIIELDGEPEKQIRWYCASENLNHGILTNGIKWRFYTFNYHEAELGAIKKIEYQEIDILNDKKEKIFNQFLGYLWNNKITDYKPRLNKKTIQQIIEGNKQVTVMNESVVKQSIVIPILKNLGWDPSNEKEFIFNPQTQIKVKKKDKINKKTIQPDYALKNTKKICIEAKSMGDKNLDVHAGHVKSFCEKKGFDIGIVTDGKLWDFLIFKKGKLNEEKCLKINNKKILTFFEKYLRKK